MSQADADHTIEHHAVARSKRSDSAITDMLQETDAPEGLATDLHMMAGAIIHDDGTAHFCDALGKVLHKPVSGWIAFMAQRLWAQARQEMARQLGDPNLTAEQCATLHESLRRELRLDALSILGHRHDEAFRLALACEVGPASIPAPRPYSTGTSSLEIIRVIEAHREASQLLMHDPIADGRRRTSAERRVRALGQAICDTPARSLADIRHKLLYLWPGCIDEYVTHSAVAEIIRSLHDDVLRLAERRITTVRAEETELTFDVPSDLAAACLWAERMRRRIDESCREEDWSEERFNEETDKINSVFTRAIEEPSRDARDTYAKAKLALEDFERFEVFVNPEKGRDDHDDGVRIVHTVLCEVAALVEA